MDSVCPICNKMKEFVFPCQGCQGAMEEKGRVAEYLGPYSADMPIENSHHCEHVFYCGKCGTMKNISVNNIFM